MDTQLEKNETQPFADEEWEDFEERVEAMGCDPNVNIRKVCLCLTAICGVCIHLITLVTSGRNVEIDAVLSCLLFRNI